MDFLLMGTRAAVLVTGIVLIVWSPYGTDDFRNDSIDDGLPDDPGPMEHHDHPHD